jgi:glycine dehydrogenase subunit 2
MKNAKPVSGPKFLEPLSFERSRAGRCGASVPPPIPQAPTTTQDLPAALLRQTPAGLPEMSEPEVVRHYVRLSQHNFAVDLGMYPLGSCTMKYNPKINEVTAGLPGFANLHPHYPWAWTQGALELMYNLEHMLAAISGMDAVTLQPAAGAHGEYTGLRVIRQAIQKRGENRQTVLIPDSAHGTNPATVTLNGWKVKPLESGPNGYIQASAVEKLMDEGVAALMMTNPNTLGLFEPECDEIARIVHAKGGFMYCDGANLNSLMGRAQPGKIGFDVMHINLHKTFSTPHGGGGPGAGPVGVVQALEPFLPIPRVVKTGDRFAMEFNRADSIGRVRAFFGNFGILVRAYTYICEMGGEGLSEATTKAVLNANYLLARLRDTWHVPFPKACMHECVLSDKDLLPAGIHNVDVAKALIDRGFHPPTVSFPIHVHGSLMIEPTETETKETLDTFVEALEEIRKLAQENPQALHDSPLSTPLSRLDETQAARHPILNVDDK